jgi:hypothetical protein
LSPEYRDPRRQQAALDDAVGQQPVQPIDCLGEPFVLALLRFDAIVDILVEPHHLRSHEYTSFIDGQEDSAAYCE